MEIELRKDHINAEPVPKPSGLLAEDFNHKPILNLPVLVARPRTQHAALIGNLLANHWRTAEKDSHPDFVVATTTFVIQALCQHLAHIMVMPLHDVADIGTPKMRRVDKTCDGRLRMLWCPMLFQQPPKHMLGDLLALLRHIRVDADVEIRNLGVCAGNFVQEVREPKQVVPVADHPVKVDAPMVGIGRRSR